MSGFRRVALWSGKVPHEQIPQLLANAKVGLDVHPWLGPHLKVAVPVKVCEYMAAGCAVVSSYMPVLSQILNEAGVGSEGIQIIDGGEPVDYARAAVQLVETIDKGADPGAKLRKSALSHMVWEKEALKIVAALSATFETTMRCLIINADGYGFTAGITRAIEECVEFGTVRSLSANVNFRYAEQLAELVRSYPDLSVGCHINPVVGKPVSPPHKVPTLLNEHGEFLYHDFIRRFMAKRIRLEELREEMIAQVDKTRDLAGPAFSHVDFHMGHHRLPGLYGLFLEIAGKFGAGRIRTHVYQVGMESRFPRLRHFLHLLERPGRLPKFIWNYGLRKKAQRRSLAMPDRRVEITQMASCPEMITIENYLRMLKTFAARH